MDDKARKLRDDIQEQIVNIEILIKDVKNDLNNLTPDKFPKEYIEDARRIKEDKLERFNTRCDEFKKELQTFIKEINRKNM